MARVTRFELAKAHLCAQWFWGPPQHSSVGALAHFISKRRFVTPTIAIITLAIIDSPFSNLTKLNNSRCLIRNPSAILAQAHYFRAPILLKGRWVAHLFSL